MTKSSSIAALIALTISGFAYGRLGIGPCPTQKVVPHPFRAGGTIPDGTYYI